MAISDLAYCPIFFRLYNQMTMEVILSTAFGRSLDVQGGNGGKLFEAAVAVFDALTPPKDDDPVNLFRILQFVLSKLYSLYCCIHSVP